MYLAKVLADSVSPFGTRLTTLEVEYPHAIHKDIMTHRALSRNFQSFRAYPPEKVIENIENYPFVPEEFQLRVTGMGQGERIPEQALAHGLWEDHIADSLRTARRMLSLGISKAQVNFVLQDLTWIRGVVSATDWDNFFALRLAMWPDGTPQARPEVYKIASMMKDAIDRSRPTKLGFGEWHLPFNTDGFVTQGEDIDTLRKISVARCARVSYLTHDGVRNPLQDIRLHDTLLREGHMSPFEHVARPMNEDDIMEGDWLMGMRPGGGTGDLYCGNFRDWVQYRKLIPGESNFASLQRS